MLDVELANLSQSCCRVDAVGKMRAESLKTCKVGSRRDVHHTPQRNQEYQLLLKGVPHREIIYVIMTVSPNQAKIVVCQTSSLLL